MIQGKGKGPRREGEQGRVGEKRERGVVRIEQRRMREGRVGGKKRRT